MSHSPKQAQLEDGSYDDYTYGWLATSQLLSEGGSLSGREKNCCYLNTGDNRFADISFTSGLDFPDDGRAVALLDWDHDGAVDVCLANRTGPRLRIMRNTNSNSSFVSLYLRGTKCNRDAIGARIEVHLKGFDTPIIRSIRAGDSFLSQSSKWSFVGLGEAEISHVVVQWPGQKPEQFENLSAGNHYLLVEGSSVAKEWQPPKTGTIETNPPAETSIGSGSRVWVADRFAVAPMKYQSTNGVSKTTPVEGKPVLVTLWAQSCETCQAELTELKSHRSELESLNLDVLALCIDEPESKTMPAASSQFLSTLQWPFESGHSNPEILDSLDIIQRILVGQRHRMPAPTSFLFDKAGQLTAIYRGPVSAKQLLSDGKMLNNSPDANYEAGLPFPGRWIQRPQAGFATANEIMFEFLNADYDEIAQSYLEQIVGRNSDKEAQLVARLNIGAAQLQSGKLALAEDSFRQALELSPKSTKACLGIAKSLSLQRRTREAAPYYLEVVKADPRNAEAHLEVGRAFAAAGKGEEAIRHLSAANELQPDALPALNILARILAMHPDPKLQDKARAKVLADHAVDISKSRDFQSLDTLATVLALQGQFQEAVDAANKAIILIPPGNPQLVVQIRRKVEAWKQQGGL